VTQTQQIRQHLLRHNSITPLEALRKYGVFRLAARICDLRSDGFSVQTVIVERGGKHFARYVMG
jgi:helix-turn-helix protein